MRRSALAVMGEKVRSTTGGFRNKCLSVQIGIVCGKRAFDVLTPGGSVAALSNVSGYSVQ